MFCSKIVGGNTVSRSDRTPKESSAQLDRIQIHSDIQYAMTSICKHNLHALIGSRAHVLWCGSSSSSSWWCCSCCGLSQRYCPISIEPCVLLVMGHQTSSTKSQILSHPGPCVRWCQLPSRRGKGPGQGRAGQRGFWSCWVGAHGEYVVLIIIILLLLLLLDRNRVDGGEKS